jgi:hypothetical protein
MGSIPPIGLLQRNRAKVGQSGIQECIGGPSRMNQEALGKIRWTIKTPAMALERSWEDYCHLDVKFYGQCRENLIVNLSTSTLSAADSIRSSTQTYPYHHCPLLEWYDFQNNIHI